MSEPKIGDRFECFTVVKLGRWGGGYSTHYTPARWVCDECGTAYWGDKLPKHAIEHAQRGHTPCALCGTVLVNRKDGSPRQHQHNRCPGKSAGHKIEREFVKNMTAREYR